jgi:hypothetical protein
MEQRRPVTLADPDHQHQTRPGPQRMPDVGERRYRIGEEHRAEPADTHVEALGR